jgi:hypothetical protein
MTKAGVTAVKHQRRDPDRGKPASS